MNSRDNFRAAMITLLVVDAIGVGLRVWVRIWKNTFRYDDWVLCAAFSGFIIFCSFEFAALALGYGATDSSPSYDLLTAAKYFVVAQLLYLIVQFIAKLSVALLLFRLAPTASNTRKCLLASMAILVIWSAIGTLIFALQCQPLSVAWGVGTGTCLSGSFIANTASFVSAMDILFSWFYAVLPIHMLWNVQLSFKTKAFVVIILGLGIFNGVATIIRLQYVIQISHLETFASPEAVDVVLTATIYSALDIGLVIFTASLTALRPLLVFMRCGMMTERSKATQNYELHPRTGPSIRLDNDRVDGGTSQEDILPYRGPGIEKKIRYELKYSEQ